MHTFTQHWLGHSLHRPVSHNTSLILQHTSCPSPNLNHWYKRRKSRFLLRRYALLFVLSQSSPDHGKQFLQFLRCILKSSWNRGKKKFFLHLFFMTKQLVCHVARVCWSSMSPVGSRSSVCLCRVVACGLSSGGAQDNRGWTRGEGGLSFHAWSKEGCVQTGWTQCGGWDYLTFCRMDIRVKQSAPSGV